MREEEANWTARWEEELPSPDELTPLSQTLITPDLALAFDIPTTAAAANPNPSDPAPPPPSSSAAHHHNHLHHPPPSDFDSGDMGGGNGGDEPARTLKRPRLVWTPQLHKRFVDAVAHLGIKNAVPKTIMQLMSVDGLTRENVASHLQKYRLYLKRMQGLGPSSGAGSGNISAADDRLFSTVPVPFPPPYVPVPTLQQHQQMAAAAQYYHQRQLGHYGSTAGHGFLARANPPQQPGLHLNPLAGLAGLGLMPPQPAAADMETDSDREGGGGGRKVLTLFPTGED